MISGICMKIMIFTPKARRRSRVTTKWSDLKSLYFEIDASSDANSFEIGKLRLSAFQNDAFCLISTSKRPLKVDFETISWLDHFVVGPLRGRVCGTRSIWPSPAHATTKWSDDGVVPRRSRETTTIRNAHISG